MSVLLIGLNHRTAPLEVREQIAFSREGIATALLLFRNQFPKAEAALLSTCNRVEMIVASQDRGQGRGRGRGDHPTIEDVISFIAQARDLPVGHFRNHLYRLSDEQAIRHLFRVASGLDSMVIGEYQIVNQVKTAYAWACEQGTTGRLLNRLFHHAFSVSKRVRTETQIGQRKVSIPSVAVDVASSIFDNFADKAVLVVGAGEMAQLVCQHLRKADVRKFTVTSRTLANAKMLAQACRGQAVAFEQLDAQLAHADIVITATACPKTFITQQRIVAAQKQRQGRAMFIIDLAVPRNVASDVDKVNQVVVYDMDALGRIVAKNQQQRMAEMPICEQILDQEMGKFEQWLGQDRAAGVIRQMYDDARQLQSMELQRFCRANPDLNQRQQADVEQLAQRLVNKLLHPCVQMLRRHSVSGESHTLARSMHEMIDKHKDQCA